MKTFTIEEAAEFLKMGVSSLYAKINNDEITVAKPGKRLVFTEIDLVNYLNSAIVKKNNAINKKGNTWHSKDGARVKSGKSTSLLPVDKEYDDLLGL